MDFIRIALDLQSYFTDSRGRGLGRYSLEIARRISRMDGPHEVRVVGRSDDPAAMAELTSEFAQLPPWTVSAISATDFQGTAANNWRVHLNERLAQRHFLQLAPDVVHVPSPFEQPSVRIATPWPTTDTLFCSTAHDLIPLLFPERYFVSRNAEEWYWSRLRTLKDSDLVFVNSEATKRDLVERLAIDPGRIVVTLLGVDESFRRREFAPGEREALLQRFGLRGRFVMYLGGWDARKNMEASIEAFAKLPRDVRESHSLALVCACEQQERRRADKVARRVGLSPGTLVQTGMVSDEDLVALYSACTLFFFPSLYEGFGLPVVEAMSCGAPVIASNISSLPEVIGRQDATFDPSTPDSIAAALAYALRNQGFLDDLAAYGRKRARAFTWASCAEQTLEGYREGLARKAARPHRARAARPPRRKVAFFTPLPPEHSGIGPASEQLLPDLERYFDLTIFTSAPDVASPYVRSNLHVLPQESFPELHHAFETVIYQFGNSTHHVQMLDYLQRYPGVVVLHDFFLSDLIDNLQLLGGRTGLLSTESEYSHGRDAFAECWDRELLLERYPLNRRVLDQAIGVIFHSEFNKEQVRAFYPAGLSTPIRVIPQARRVRSDLPSREEARRRLGIGREEFLVASFGMTHRRKCTREVIQAFEAAAARADRPMRLALVGKNDDSQYGVAVRQCLDALPAHAPGKLTGFAERDVYDCYLAAADAAIQLRSGTRGETSGAVLDALASGLPTILNAYAGFNDYPEGVVLKTPAQASPERVAERLLELVRAPELRSRVGEAARGWILSRHSPAEAAARYSVAVEEFLAHHAAVDPASLIAEMAEMSARDGTPYAELARQFVANEVDLRRFRAAAPDAPPSL